MFVKEFECIQICIHNATGFKIEFEEIKKLYAHFWENYKRPSSRKKGQGNHTVQK